MPNPEPVLYAGEVIGNATGTAFNAFRTAYNNIENHGSANFFHDNNGSSNFYQQPQGSYDIPAYNTTVAEGYQHDPNYLSNSYNMNSYNMNSYLNFGYQQQRPRTDMMYLKYPGFYDPGYGL